MASKLIQTSPYEAKNQTELSLQQAFEFLEPRLRPPFPLTIPNPQEYLQLNQAILYGVLVEPHFAKTHIKHLHAIVTNGYCSFVNFIIMVVKELYIKLIDTVRIQLIWVTKEMIDVSAIGVNDLLVFLLRQIIAGDFSDDNLWLCFEVVSIFWAKWDCLLEVEPMILTSALYTYLRLLSDHCRLFDNKTLDAIRRLEIKFCIRVLKEQFHLCLKIGRDLIRLLQDLVQVPEFRALWKDLVFNPNVFRTPGFSDISQLVQRGVIPSLDVVISCDALSPFLKERLGNFLSGFKVEISKELCPLHLPHQFVKPLISQTLSCTETSKPSHNGQQPTCTMRMQFEVLEKRLRNQPQWPCLLHRIGLVRTGHSPDPVFGKQNREADMFARLIDLSP